MQCTANHTSNRDVVRYLEKGGALGEVVGHVQGLTKPKKNLAAWEAAGFLELQ